MMLLGRVFGPFVMPPSATPVKFYILDIVTDSAIMFVNVCVSVGKPSHSSS